MAVRPSFIRNAAAEASDAMDYGKILIDLLDQLEMAEPIWSIWQSLVKDTEQALDIVGGRAALWKIAMTLEAVAKRKGREHWLT